MNTRLKRLGVLCVVLFAGMIGGLKPISAQTFKHPGVLMDKPQLDYVKAMVQAHVEPFYSTFVKAQNSSWGSLTYVPVGPPAGGFIQCGSTSVPDIGCSDSDNDSTAAFTQALLWYITGNQTYAQNSIKIMNLYARNLKGYDTAYSNAPLQAAWDGEKWPRAAELIRYSNAGWSDSDIAAFQSMLVTAILPRIQAGSTSNGNWEISMIESLIGIGVFNDNQTIYNTGITYYRQRIPAYFYYHTDGATYVKSPRGTADWYGQTVFDPSVDGISQETCRDFGHAQYSVAGALNAAETAHIQGTDLYTEFKDRLIAMMEFHSYYQLGNPVPTSVCGGVVTLQTYPTYEIGYNEFHNRLGATLPNTLQYLNTTIRQMSNPVDYHMMVYESLTHGGDASSLPAFLLYTPTSAATLKAGASTTAVTNVIVGSSSTANVGLSVSGLPSGATASFSPATVSGAGTATLTISTGSSTVAGVYPLTITGTSGSSTYTNPMTLTINSPAADYTLTASPNPAVGVAGSSVTYTTTLSPLSGYRGSVSLSASGLPTGATASFSSTTISETNPASTLTVTTTGATPQGAYGITITGNDGTISHSATASLIINPISSGCIAQLGNSWINGVLPTQTGTFTAQWDATPSSAINNTNVGLSLGAQVAFTGFAVSARFNPTGTIDARNGGAFAAVNSIPYAAGVTYHFRAVVNTAAKTYSIYVTPAGGTEQTVGTNYAFRTEQAGIASIDYWDAISQVGTVNLCNLTIDSADFDLQVTPASASVQAGASTSYATTLLPHGAFTGTVVLTATGLPTGATATFNPSAISSTTTASTLTVATTAAVAPGLYPISVTGTSGTLTHSIYAGLTVTAACAAPVAAGQSVSAPQNGTAAITLAASLGANCSAANMLTYTVATQPAHGVLTGTAPYLIYTPTAGYTGTDSFTFTATDSKGTPSVSAAATVSITVAAVAPTAPAIATISPATTSAGGAAFTLTVNGVRFTSPSTVLWNGASRTTTFVSATQLTAAITAADIATAGVANVTVQTGAGVSAARSISIDTPSATGKPTITAPTSAVAVTHGSMVNIPMTLTGTVAAFTSVACYNLPVGANCTFNVASSILTVTTNASTPTGTYNVLTVLTTTAGTTTAGFAHSVWLAIAGMLIGAIVFFALKRQRASLRWFASLGVLLICLSGCGGTQTTAPVTQTSVAAQSSTSFTLTVN